MNRAGPVLAVFVALIVSPAVSTAQPASSAEPPLMVYNPTNKHYYQTIHVANGLTWMEAYQAAAKRVHLGVRGHLATLATEAEQRFVTSALAPGEAWFGAYQDRRAPDYKEPAGGWRWVTGEPWGYTAWHEGEPNHAESDSDVAMFWSNDRWNDAPLSWKVGPYVVEFDTTGPDPSRPPLLPTQEIDQLLTRVLRRSQAIKSYSATVEFSFKAHVDTLAAIRVSLVIQPPGRFRLEGRGNNGSIVAVADGRQYLIARTYPRERMHFLVKPLRGLREAIREAFSLLMDPPLPPK